MSRPARAMGYVDLDAHAKSEGFQSAGERHLLTQVHAELGRGERPSAAHIVERVRPFYPGTPVETLHRFASYMLAGANVRDRQDRMTEVWAMSVGVPAHQIPAVCEQARAQSEQLAIQEYAMPLTEHLDGRDQHRDRGNGIDSRARVEQAHRAAMTNPETVRRADVAHAMEQHEGVRPLPFSWDRRQIVAGKIDRNVEQMQKQMVIDADPQRRPDRSDDRTNHIRLAYNMLENEAYAHDELALRDNPVLENVDNAMTYAESMERE